VAGFSAEGFACLHVSAVDDLVFTMGSGTGLAQGVGTPDFRVISGLVWSPQREPPPPALKEDDGDGDGVPDAQDQCPDQPEDHNGVDDGDGCPDGAWTPTTLMVVEEGGALIAGARVELIYGPDSGEWVVESGELMRALLPGTYEVKVAAEGYEPLEISMGVPFDTQYEHRLNMVELAGDGRLVINVTDSDGAPLEARLKVLRQGEASGAATVPTDGVLEKLLPPSMYEVVISAPGHRTERRTIDLRAGTEALVDVVLPPSKVEVRERDIKIYDRIFFELDSDHILGFSYAVLDELADILKEHDEIALVEIQGHTDTMGPAHYNTNLSQKRADAVRRYLVKKGVSAARLKARGYGESRPMDVAEHSLNRRVEFHILKRGS